MKKIPLGHSGIAVSQLCLGILPFGTKVDERTFFAILDAYYEAGGRFITRSDKKLPNQYAGPSADARLAVLAQVAVEYGVTVNQAIYAWMLQSDPPVIPLTAPTSLEQLHENLGALAIQLSADQMQRLDASGRP